MVQSSFKDAVERETLWKHLILIYQKTHSVSIGMCTPRVEQYNVHVIVHAETLGTSFLSVDTAGEQLQLISIYYNRVSKGALKINSMRSGSDAGNVLGSELYMSISLIRSLWTLESLTIICYVDRFQSARKVLLSSITYKGYEVVDNVAFLQ